VFPPLGILYLSAWLGQSGYSAECIDFALNGSFDDAKSDIVGISFTTPQRFEAFSLAKRYKRRGKITIAGGPHPTHLSRECLDNGFDFVVIGEGEQVLTQLITSIRNRGVSATMLMNGRVFGPSSEYVKLDKIPYPNREAVDIHAYKYAVDGIPATTMMTTRGCPYSCSFCARITKGCRVQSADRTLREIFNLNVKYGFKAFMIFDDVFIIDHKRMVRMAEVLEPAGFTFRCFARANLINAPICDLMRRMGVVEVGIGVESGSDAVLKRNMKGTTREMNANAFRLLKEHGIRPKAFLIVGLPGETHDTVKETESWIVETEPFDIDVSVFQPLPGSPIFQHPERWGVQFQYDGLPGWYKGTPGKYETSVRTDCLTSEEIVMHRDELEMKYKRKEFLK
jgi:anaerobic magnesium-protoporphyrin IX monomethyl ester cyclase